MYDFKKQIDVATRKLVPTVFSLIHSAQPGTFVFSSYGGTYSDSPRAVSEKLHDLRPALKIPWMINPKLVSNELLPDYVVPLWGMSWFHALSVAQIVVDNAYGFNSAAISASDGPIRREFARFRSLHANNEVISTWHGIPAKRMGVDRIGNDIVDFFCPKLTVAVGSKLTGDVLRRTTFGKANVVISGTPRNDVLINISDNDVKKARNKIGVPDGKRLVTYAPTFRSANEAKEINIRASGVEQIKSMDIPLLLQCFSESFGGDWVFAPRVHHYVAKMISINEYINETSNLVIDGNSGEMVDYILASDCLITDYSSCIFDFMITGKPAFFFCNDYTHYKTQERGFYIDPQDSGLPFSDDFESLLNCIIDFNKESYSKKVKTLMDNIGIFEDGIASERIAKLVIERTCI